MAWLNVEFDEERLALLQMRLGSVDLHEEDSCDIILNRKELLERYYWGFQKLLNLLPPNNALSIGPQLNNDLVHYRINMCIECRRCMRKCKKRLECAWNA